MVVETAPAANPLAIGQVVARNIVPIVGVLAFGWSAVNVLLLYFVDTLFSFGVMFAGLASHFGRQSSEPGVAARINSEAGAIAVAVFLCAFVAVPLGMPLVFVGAMSGWEGFGALWQDHALLGGIACQAVAAVWSYWALWQALHERSPDELRLKRRFALVFLRWFVIVAAVYFPIAFLFGRFLPHVLIVLYAATSIVVEVWPEKFLRMMPGGAEDADARPGTPAPPPKRYSRTRKR